MRVVVKRRLAWRLEAMRTASKWRRQWRRRLMDSRFSKQGDHPEHAPNKHKTAAKNVTHEWGSDLGRGSNGCPEDIL